MNNDNSQKVLEKLDSMGQDIKIMQTDIKTMKTDITVIQTDVKTLQTNIKAIQKDITITKNSTLIMETEHSRKIDLILENYVENTEKHEHYDSKISSHDDTIDLHSFEIELLKNKT